MRKLVLLALPLFLVSLSLRADDKSDPLAELAALGSSVADSGPEAGGSIRAKKDVDMSRDTRLKAAANLEGKVETVKTGKFPTVALKIRVVKPAKEGAGKDVKANETIVVVPKFKVAGSAVELTDTETAVNAGSFYLLAGDKVALRLGAKKDKVWEAEYIERK